MPTLGAASRRGRAISDEGTGGALAGGPLSSNATLVAAALAALLLAIGLAVLARRSAARAAEQQRTVAMLDAVLEHAPIGIAMLDRELRFVRVNDQLLRLNGMPVGEHLGRPVGEVLGDERVEETARRVVTTGRSILDVRLDGIHRATGEPLHVVASYYPVRSADGEIVGVGTVVQDTTGEVLTDRHREVLFERLSRLQSATVALAAARTTEEVVNAVLAEVRSAAGASAASLAVLEEGEIRVLDGDGYDEETLRRWGRFPVDAQVPMAEAVRTGQLITAGNRAEVLERWPDLASSLGEGERALAVLPLVVEGTTTGAIGLSIEGARDFDEPERVFLAAVATQCSQALRRAALTDSERGSRERLVFLASATATLTESLELDSTLERLAALAVPQLADWCSVFLLEDGVVRQVAQTHVDPSKVETVEHLLQRWPVSLDAEQGIGAVLRTGTSQHFADLSADVLERLIPDEERRLMLLDVGFTSGLVVPLRSKGATLGALVLATSGTRRLVQDDIDLAHEVAARAAQAVLNAVLFHDRTHVADVLQRSLLPRSVPTVPGVDVATRFVPVGEGIDVGGDFYDVFRLGPVRDETPSWAVVIGDVRGKGAEAAAITGAARHAVRTAGLRTTSPAAMLRELNEVLLVLGEERDDATLEPMFCTAVIATITPGENGTDVVVSVGGHPPPLLLHADGATTPVGTAGDLLGVVDDPRVEDVEVALRPGEAFVLYTDGVTERHSGDHFFDEEGLAAAVSRCAGFTAEAVAERIELAARAFVEDEPRDDIAIVVVRAPTRTATSSSTSADLPLDAEGPRLARRFVVEVLGLMGRTDLTEPAALLTSELVTNAVIHGAGPLRVSVEPRDDHVRVCVADAGEGRPAVTEPDEGSLHGRGMLLVERLSARWGIEDAAGAPGKSVWFELA